MRFHGVKKQPKALNLHRKKSGNDTDILSSLSSLSSLFLEKKANQQPAQIAACID
jgi:hypothetical protein